MTTNMFLLKTGIQLMLVLLVMLVKRMPRNWVMIMMIVTTIPNDPCDDAHDKDEP